ncbi:MAG: spermidine/putrescine transport system substrate-binding protein [Verrucomicrobiales bacterium]|jgi:spermidine/putrescine transport system substrate-binding protein
MSKTTIKNTTVQVFLILSAAITFACSSRDQEGKEQSSTGGIQRSAGEVLNVLTWEDYVAPEVLEGFTERTGIEVNMRTFENTKELIGELRASSDKHDVVIFDNSSVIRLAETQLLRELDHSALPGMRNLDKKFVDLAIATDKGNRFSIPYLWGSTLVAYRKDKIENPEPSFELLFDERLKGKVLMLDDPFESIPTRFSRS